MENDIEVETGDPGRGVEESVELVGQLNAMYTDPDFFPNKCACAPFFSSFSDIFLLYFCERDLEQLPK